MKKLINTTIIKEWLALTIGVIAAIAVVFSQTTLVSSQNTTDTETHAHTDSGDSDEDNHDITTISQDAVSSIAQLTLANGLHFITDIDQNEGETVKVQLDHKVDFNAFFKTLFRLIISPNAP